LNPKPTTELEYATPYELLVAVTLSAQATDVGVNKATRKLFPIANTPTQMAALGVDGLKPYIATIGLFNTKAANVVAMAHQLLERTPVKCRAIARRWRRYPAWGARRRTSCSTRPSANPPSPSTPISSALPTAPAWRRARTCVRWKRARESHPRALPAGRASLADPARPLRMQGPQAGLPALCDPRPVPVSGQDTANRCGDA
jgi:hypothetical protein